LSSPPPLVIVRGGGDLATGAARKLHLAGLRVVVSERAHPWCVRRRAAFASAIADGSVVVEGVRAKRVELSALAATPLDEEVAVVICPDRPVPPGLDADLLVDARVLKRGHDTTLGDAPRVVGVGPGFRVGAHCHAAVESSRGFDLGRVLYSGETQAFDQRPGDVAGIGGERVLRADTGGLFVAAAQIGDSIGAGQRVGEVAGRPVLARTGGCLRGLLADGTEVRAHQKLGDVDPRGHRSYCDRVSDKANAVGGGVLEAALVLLGR